MDLEWIDVLVNSSGRLDFLQPTITSMLEKLKFSGRYRITLFEDVVKKESSRSVLGWAQESKLFDRIVKVEPAKRLGVAIWEGLQLVNTSYVVKWEDDWFFRSKVSLDEILNVMERDTKINQISFNKHRNEIDKHGIVRPVVDCGPFKVTQVNEWVLGPGIWRTGFVKERWPRITDAHEAVYSLGTYNLKIGCDWTWMYNNVGAYFYGGHDEGPYLDHIGTYSWWTAPIEGVG